jgi:hypothetical protein
MLDNPEHLRSVLLDTIKERDALLTALRACVESMADAYPNGLPVQMGTLSEEQDWDTALRMARAAIANAEGGAR